MLNKFREAISGELWIKWLIIFLVLAGLVIGFFWYGHIQYRAGEDATDLKWQKASIEAQAKAAQAATEASDSSYKRVVEYNDTVAVEKEKLDEAEKQGKSPFDVLFSGSN